MLLFCSLYAKTKKSKTKQSTGCKNMLHTMKENSGLNNGFAKEFAALSSLCGAGYLWLLLI